MNRAEYRNAIRDLFTLDVDVTSLLPADDASYGFDNMAGVLRLNQSVMERYLAAAGKISRAAIAWTWGSSGGVGSVGPVDTSKSFQEGDRKSDLITAGKTMSHAEAQGARRKM